MNNTNRFQRTILRIPCSIKSSTIIGKIYCLLKTRYLLVEDRQLNNSTTDDTKSPRYVLRNMRFSPIFAIVASISAARAFTCSGSLNPYCCESSSLTPRGYIGSNCQNSTATDGGFTCSIAPFTSFLCCQGLHVLENGQTAAYYCGQPQS
ncbi:hypothetical protein BT63DRAFT_481884 [Microthyrium microscopicum]|uniref:Hydrophobin n=1 Tax=Microthyrium microscopicum TaxID=703497 RepID=A0A6A6U3R2_9PEZI|nr:hypothetical protein BT63DRAFT_481884 [Microthyrium microscopicum]